jgi:Chalcone isomerase-like
MPAVPVSRRRALLALGVMPRSLWAQAGAVPIEVAAELAGSRLYGTGRLTYFGLSIYDARLWTGVRFNAERFDSEPLALELQYNRALRGKLIAQRSLTEMQRTGAIPEADASRWLASMTRLFPDVGPSDRLTGVHRPGESARFYFNGGLRGEVREAAFAGRFFGIWLSPQTSEPRLRQALLGLGQAGS